MTALVVILLFVCLGLPLFYAWHIWRLDEPSIVAWLLVVADACVFVALIILVGRWDMAGYMCSLSCWPSLRFQSSPRSSFMSTAGGPSPTTPQAISSPLKLNRSGICQSMAFLLIRFSQGIEITYTIQVESGLRS